VKVVGVIVAAIRALRCYGSAASATAEGKSMQADYDDARAVAQLPNLDIEILHRRPWRGDGEMLSITLRAKPSFDAFFNFLEANPAVFWMRAFEMAWSPWLQLGGAPAQLPREK
jgi:hypothetical protein